MPDGANYLAAHEELKTAVSANNSESADMTGADVHSQTAKEKALEDLERMRAEFLDSGRRPPHPGGGVTGTFGAMGSGKTLLVATWLCALYARGVDVKWTSTAGLRFGEPIEDLEELFAIAKDQRNVVIFIDELQSYLNKYSSNATSAVMMTESLAALRKNRVHLIYTGQHDSQVYSAMRYNTTKAWYPRQSTYRKLPHRKRVPVWKRKDRYEKVSGKYDFCKLQVWELDGNALSFTEAPDHLHMRMRWPVPMPKARVFRPAYADVEMASKLYNTLEQLEFGARWKVNAEIMKDHIGVLTGSGRGRNKGDDDVIDLSQHPEMAAAFQEMMAQRDADALMQASSIAPPDNDYERFAMAR